MTTATGAVHMQVVYVLDRDRAPALDLDTGLAASGYGPQVEMDAPPVGPSPDDVALALRQLERLVTYARLADPRQVALTDRELDLIHILRMQREVDDVMERLAADALIAGRWSRVSVVSLRMESPLVAVVEIPSVVWLAAAFGLIALAERVATMRVRIARKRKEELAKIAISDLEIATLHARADALAAVLLAEGPNTGGVTEVMFTAGDDPDDELTDSDGSPEVDA